MASSKVGEDGQRWQMVNDSGCGWRAQKPRLGGAFLSWSTAKAKPKSGQRDDRDPLLAALQPAQWVGGYYW
jgi:hypothetical protein